MRVNTDQITIGDRRREDMGDIQGLAESIAKHGLLHPVVLDVQNNLVAGGRRLAAVKSLGLTEIEVTYLGDLSESELREVELEENLRRKDLTEIEKSRDMVALAEIKAEQVQSEFCTQGVQKPNEPGRPQKPDSVRKVAEAIGVSPMALVEARQHVRAVESYPVLELLPKKEAIQTAKKLDTMPPEKREPALKTIQETVVQLPLTPEQEKLKRMSASFRKGINDLFKWLERASMKPASYYFEGYEESGWSNSIDFFSGDNLELIDEGIEWLKLFRSEYALRVSNKTNEPLSDLRRVK